MTRRVEGKVASVTGAANGIGRGAAMVLAREGAKIIATDLQDEKGEGAGYPRRDGSLGQMEMSVALVNSSDLQIELIQQRNDARATQF